MGAERRRLESASRPGRTETPKATPVRHVYGFGYSQTGGFMFDYINGIQPLVVVASDGRPMFDGYIVAVASGRFVGLVPINQCEPTPSSTTDPRYQFHNAGTPIIHVMSQSDYLYGVSLRRPDGDTYPDLYRHYEMAGAAHATPDELFYSAAPADIVKAGRPVPPMNCNEGPRSRFPSHIFFDAFLVNLERWVRSRHRAAAPAIRSSSRTGAGARRVRQRHRRPSLAVPRRSDEHVVRELDWILVLLHRRPRGPVHRGAAAGALSRTTART